jgi:predicted ArsR family transcriptional regulator
MADSSHPGVEVLLADQDVRFILTGTFFAARSARELSERYGIPLATCYRKVKFLQRAGLLRPERTVLRGSGRPVTLMKAHLPAAQIMWDQDRVMLSFVPNDLGGEGQERVGLILA